VAVLAAVTGVPVTVHMIVTSCAIIYIGSHGSVAALLPEDAKAMTSETMQTRDAYLFPVIGSAVLFSLYIVFKLVPREYINVVIKAYFFVIGCLVLSHRAAHLLSQLMPKRWVLGLEARFVKFRVPTFNWPWAKKADAATTADDQKTTVANTTPIPPVASSSSAVNTASTTATPPSAATAAATTTAAAAAAAVPVDNSVTVTLLDVIGLLVATPVGVWYLTHNHWSASNIFGIAFCIQGIEMLGLGSFFNGVILLSGLFVYDIFWVFGTEVMVTVATSFDAPIKLLFPQLDPLKRHSMLGLGDIVIPGIFIALLLRLDYALKLQTERPEEVRRTYFWVSFIMYFLGLMTTVAIMYWFEHAQPALLYLVPACLLAAFGTALVRGHLRILWTYTEDDPSKSKGA